MRVTTQGEYGLRCMINIGKNQDAGPVPIQKISKDEGLPRTYVEQLLLKLRRSQLIKSVRGARGGYLLARPASEISMKDVIIALEGTTFEIVCERRLRSRVSCKYLGTCVLNEIWYRLQAVVETFMDGISLEELVNEEEKLYREGRIKIKED